MANFSPNAVRTSSFRMAKKFDEIDPCSQVMFASLKGKNPFS
jgi:hypothetical protein